MVKRYTEKEKEKALATVRRVGPTKASRELGIHESLLYKWKRAAKGLKQLSSTDMHKKDRNVDKVAKDKTTLAVYEALSQEVQRGVSDIQQKVYDDMMFHDGETVAVDECTKKFASKAFAGLSISENKEAKELDMQKSIVASLNEEMEYLIYERDFYRDTLKKLLDLK